MPSDLSDDNEYVACGLQGIAWVYIDDIVMFSKTQEEHEEHVSRVQHPLRNKKLFAKSKNYILAQQEI